MKEVVAWTLYSMFVVLAAATFAVCTYFVVDFYKRRQQKAVSIRMPQITVFQLICTAVVFLFDVITIPLYHYSGEEYSYQSYITMKITYVIAIVTAKITRIWCFNWKYALTRHEMESLWKTEMQVAESKSWAVRYAAVFSNWRRALLFWFVIVAMVLFVATSVLFGLTDSRMAVSIGVIVGFMVLYVPAFWALYRTKDCRDIYGMRTQLMLEVYLGLILFIGGAVMSVFPPMSFSHRFASFSVFIVFTAAYFPATTRFQLWKMDNASAHDSVFRSTLFSSLFSQPSIALSSGRTSLNKVLVDYASFELLAEHCHREMAVSHLFFVVAYMRLKEYMFRFLKAEDLFKFEAGAEPNDDGGDMLQNVVKKLRLPMPTVVVRSTLLARSYEKIPSAHSCSSVGIESSELPTLSLDSQIDSNLDTAIATKEKFCHELGRVVSLPERVLQLDFADYALDGCVQRISDLFDRYVHLEGDHCVNVSSSVRKTSLSSLRILVTTETATERLHCLWDCVEACDQMLAEVMQVLKSNSFYRFLRTPECQKWLESAK